MRAVEEHLLRHGAAGAVPEGEVDRAAALLGSVATEHPGSVLVHLDWTHVLPRLCAYRLTAEPADLAELADPADAADGPRRLGVAASSALAAQVSDPDAVTLNVPRTVPVDFDPHPAPLSDLDPWAQRGAAAAVALAAATEAHPVATQDQVAAAAGALLADAAYRGDEIRTAADTAERFTRLYHALGGACEVVSVDSDRIEIAVRQSPFGAAVCSLPALSRVTEAIAGRLGARVNGRATVVHDERLALGDDTDRVQIFLGEAPDGVAGSRYRWPPAGVQDPVAPSPRLEMTVSLPRQSHSVPVIRRLATQTLRAFGVSADSINDVEIAISEACANVIQHAVDSEGYEVTIELAADRCAITVLDRGEGFDAASVAEQRDPDAEGGRGLTLMRALVDNLNFVSEPKTGAVVHMVKDLDYEEGHPFRRTSSR